MQRSIRTSPVDTHLSADGRGFVLSAAAVHELPILGPQARITQKIDHYPGISGMRGPEDDCDRSVVLSQLVLVETAPLKDGLCLRSVQPLDELLVLRRVSAADGSDPDAGVLVRRHLRSVPQLRPRSTRPRRWPGTPDTSPEPRR